MKWKTVFLRLKLHFLSTKNPSTTAISLAMIHPLANQPQIAPSHNPQVHGKFASLANLIPSAKSAYNLVSTHAKKILAGAKSLAYTPAVALAAGCTASKEMSSLHKIAPIVPPTVIMFMGAVGLVVLNIKHVLEETIGTPHPVEKDRNGNSNELNTDHFDIHGLRISPARGIVSIVSSGGVIVGFPIMATCAKTSIDLWLNMPWYLGALTVALGVSQINNNHRLNRDANCVRLETRRYELKEDLIKGNTTTRLATFKTIISENNGYWKTRLKHIANEHEIFAALFDDQGILNSDAVYPADEMVAVEEFLSTSLKDVQFSLHQNTWTKYHEKIKAFISANPESPMAQTLADIFAQPITKEGPELARKKEYAVLETWIDSPITAKIAKFGVDLGRALFDLTHDKDFALQTPDRQTKILQFTKRVVASLSGEPWIHLFHIEEAMAALAAKTTYEVPQVTGNTKAEMNTSLDGRDKALASDYCKKLPQATHAALLKIFSARLIANANEQTLRTTLGESEYQRQVLRLYRIVPSGCIEAAKLILSIYCEGSPKKIESHIESGLIIATKLREFNAHRIYTPIVALVRDETVTPRERTAALDLYARLYKEWPEKAILLVEEVWRAMTKKIVKSFAGESEKIIEFIRAGNIFIPEIYPQFLKEGPVAITRYTDYARAALNDKLGPDEIKRIITENKSEGLLLVSQLALPVSSQSFIQRNEIEQTINDGLSAGDRRLDVPEGLRGNAYKFTIDHDTKVIKKDFRGDALKIDPTDRVKEILKNLQAAPQNKEKAAVAAFIKAAKTYLEEMIKGPDDKETQKQRVKLFDLLIEVMKHKVDLKQKVAGLTQLDYDTLEILEDFLTEKDNLYPHLIELLKDMPDELFDGTREDIKKPDQVISALLGSWKSLQSEPDKLAINIIKILRRYKQSEVEKILGDSRVPAELREAAQKIMTAANAEIYNQGRQKIARELILPETNLVGAEKAKYESIKGEPENLSLRALKGPLMVLNGSVTGVCTAKDMSVWQNPDFFVAAIVHEDQNKAVGFLQLLTQVIDGKKTMVVISVNPSSEFMATQNAKKLYQKIMKQVEAMAKDGGYQQIIIPSYDVIHSNRPEIQAEIAKQKYKPIQLTKKIVWNSKYPNYNFTNAMLVWQEAA